LTQRTSGGRAGERIFFGDLGRRVAAAGVGDALVAAEQVRAVNEATDGIEADALVSSQPKLTNCRSSWEKGKIVKSGS